ncbi:MAG: hypothetical protein C4291_14610 [Candidatus Dadabacteria bacterium]
MVEFEFKELEALKADVDKLRSDLLDITEKLTDIGKDGAWAAKEGLERQAKELKKRLRKILKDTHKMRKKMGETIQGQIEDRGLMSLIVAAGAGLLLGVLVTWIIKDRDSG